MAKAIVRKTTTSAASCRIKNEPEYEGVKQTRYVELKIEDESKNLKDIEVDPENKDEDATRQTGSQLKVRELRQKYGISEASWNRIKTALVSHLLLVDLFPSLTGFPGGDFVSNVLKRLALNTIDKNGEIYGAVKHQIVLCRSRIREMFRVRFDDIFRDVEIPTKFALGNINEERRKSVQHLVYKNKFLYTRDPTTGYLEKPFASIYIKRSLYHLVLKRNPRFANVIGPDRHITLNTLAGVCTFLECIMTKQPAFREKTHKSMYTKWVRMVEETKSHIDLLAIEREAGKIGNIEEGDVVVIPDVPLILVDSD